MEPESSDEVLDAAEAEEVVPLGTFFFGDSKCAEGYQKSRTREHVPKKMTEITRPEVQKQNNQSAKTNSNQ